MAVPSPFARGAFRFKVSGLSVPAGHLHLMLSETCLQAAFFPEHYLMFRSPQLFQVAKLEDGF